MKSSRSHLVIVVMGLGGLGILGFLMKFAVDSNPELASLGRAKQAFASDFSERGLEQIDIRSLPGKRGYVIRATLDDESVRRVEKDGHEAIAREYAQYFLKHFEGKTRRQIHVKLVEAPGFGCSAPRVVAKRDFATTRLRRELDLRAGIETLRGLSDEALGLTVREIEILTLDTLRVEVVVDDASNPGERTEEQLGKLLDESRTFLEQALLPVPVRSATLVLRSSREPDAILGELEVNRPRASRRKIYRKRSRLDPVEWDK